MTKSLRILAIFIFAIVSLAQVKPITKKGLIDALKIGGLTQPELVQFVKQRGVDFKPSTADEIELKGAGASAELMDAVKASFRAPAKITPPPAAGQTQSQASTKGVPTKPLTKTEIVTLLQVGTPSERIIQLAKARGIGFRMTPDVTTELQKAGADANLVSALNGAQPNHAPVATPPKGPVMQKALVADNTPPAPAPATPPPAPATPVSASIPTVTSAPPAAPHILSLKEVKKVFVEPMPNNLDQFLREEIGKQMKGRFAVTKTRSEADAVLTAVAARPGPPAVSLTDLSGNTVLWSEEAEDRNVLFRAIKRGGPQKMADRLVSKLKVAAQ